MPTTSPAPSAATLRAEADRLEAAMKHPVGVFGWPEKVARIERLRAAADRLDRAAA